MFDYLSRVSFVRRSWLRKKGSRIWICSRYKTEAKWKRFHPFRVVRKIFRRRVKREGTSEVSDASKKSWSTSELQSVQEHGSGKCEVASPLKIGLSVSHDSIFSPEGNVNVNSEELNAPRGSSLSVRHTSIKTMFKDELFTRVRARRDSDEDEDDDDIGLPRSPCTSPTTVDVLTQGLKDKSLKSQTTCSAGSLISMESSENDEDSAGQSSGHSSRMSLLDRRSLDSEGDPDQFQSVPLSHKAAHHKIAVRPKRTYGLPRRRMNQLAAAKNNTLPSTPEITEDNAKSFLKLEVTEIVKTISEFSTSSTSESSTAVMQSTDCHTSSHISSATSYGEISSAYETQMHQIKQLSVLESSQVVSDDDSKWHGYSDRKQDVSSPYLSEDHAIEDTVNSSSRSHDTEEKTSKSSSSLFDDFKRSFMDKTLEPAGVMESVRLMKTGLETSIRNETVFKEDSVLNQQDAPLRVSSLIKNIERSDSFKNADKVAKQQDEQSVQSLCNKKLTSDHKEFSDIQKAVSDSLEINSTLKSEKNLEESLLITQNLTEKVMNTTGFASSETQVKTHHTSQEFFNEAVKKSTSVTEKLDIDSEFVLKPIRKDLKHDSDAVFQQEKVQEKSSDRSLMSSVYLEEESIMSDKTLSLGLEESRIFISHHASFSNDLNDILVTEAHNYAAADDKIGVSVQTSQDRSIESKKEKRTEPWISSVGISASKTTVTDVTVNSLTSTICDKKMMEDKVTISVNSMPDRLKSKSPDVNRRKDDVTTSTASKKSAPNKPNSNPKTSPKERSQSKTNLRSHLPDGGLNSSNVKSSSVQKRVSVEIVPFSQRMKERKYQPLSFSSKDTASDTTKKNSSAVVERKLSDRKVTMRNKESEKSNNRHSFSGALTTDSGKKNGETVIEKNIVSTEKMQYPVQIRIHKSVPKAETKEKVLPSSRNIKEAITSSSETTSDVKFYMQSAKVNESKQVKEPEKIIHENSTKWEIKIQPAPQSQARNPSPLNFTENEEHNANLLQNSFVKSNDLKLTQLSNNTKEIDNKELPLNQPAESPPMKSRENSWKSSKETPPPSDDPEPELLRVFARRSIKQKHCDKGNPDDKDDKIIADTSSDDSLPFEVFEKSDSESSNQMISVSQNSTVIKISEVAKPHISKPDLIKKKSKSFSEKEKLSPRSVSPLKETNLIRRESPTKLLTADYSCNEPMHPRQRLASVPDLPVNLPPDTEKRTSARSPQNGSSTENSPAPSLKDEHLHRANSISVPLPTAAVNGSLGLVKDNQEMLGGKEAHTPAWLQLAQQRRELREQRERLLLGGATNSFLDASSKPSRSSKVWDMVNNFQKLQMT